MALPKLTRPMYTYENNVAGTDYKLKYFPYLNSHEFLLAEAKNGTPDDRKNAVIQILEDCIRGEGTIKNLPSYVIEHVFLNIHAKSVGETQRVAYICRNKSFDGIADIECGNRLEFDIDFTKFKINVPDGFQTKFDLGGGVCIMFKIPTFEDFSEEDFTKPSNNMMDVLKPCVKSVYDEETVYNDFTKEELDTFMDSILPIKKIEIFNKFFTKIPHIQYKRKIKCSKCGMEHEIIINSIDEVLDPA